MIQDIAEGLYRKYGNKVDMNKGMPSRLLKLYGRLFLLDKEIPPFFNLEPTNICNLNCYFCPNSESSRERGFISLALVKKISGEVAKHGGRSYFLFKDGEPFLHPSLLEIIKIIKKAHKKNRIFISTNGHLLDAKTIRSLIELRVDNLNFSLDAATEKAYRQIKNASLQKVEKNIHTLLNIKAKQKSPYPHVALHFVECKENRNEIEQFKQRWADKPVTLKFMYFNSWAGFFPEGKKFDEIKRYPCFSLWMFPSINWDGKVSICCVDWNQQEVIGDLNKQTFEEIWNGKKIKKYRELHLQGKYQRIPICAQCNIWASRPNFLK